MTILRTKKNPKFLSQKIENMGEMKPKFKNMQLDSWENRGIKIKINVFFVRIQKGILFFFKTKNLN